MSPEPFGAGVVLGLEEHSLLGPFNAAGILAPADVHVALRLAQLGGDRDELVALAAALAVRAPRVGHVHVDLAAVQATVAADLEEDVEVDSLPWPGPSEWVAHVASSAMVTVGEDGPEERPLRLVGSALYLDRYWRDEVAVAADIIARSEAGRLDVDPTALDDGLARLFPGRVASEQRWAAALATLGSFSVIAGGPGTGKTTTVARTIALLEEQAVAAGTRPPLVALAAPTGKAAARMAEAVRAEARRMDVSAEVRARLVALETSTLHRLLVRHPGNASRFRHNRLNRLPHDVVVIDETSMVSLWLMARLIEAVRPDARLVLVGDPEQLVSVEAGAVLGDIVGPASRGLATPTPEPAQAPQATPAHQVTPAPPPRPPGSRGIASCIAMLRTNHRFHGALAELAGAVRAGAADEVLQVLSGGDPAVRWLQVDVSVGRAADNAGTPPAAGSASSPAAEGDRTPAPPAAKGAGPGEIDAVRSAAVATGLEVVEAALAGDSQRALDALGRSRLLCAHRLGPAGVSTWNARIEAWLADEIEHFSPAGTWYVGRPVVVTANDYGIRLFNGDTGVAVARKGTASEDRLGVAFARAGVLAVVSPSRLSAVATAFAMTIHKGQGSEFDEVVVVLPQPTSRVLTRELLYTAVTRARKSLVLVGTEGSVRTATDRPVARASGLTARLWAASPKPS